MFTGIIEATAPVLKRTDRQLILERPQSFDDLKLGSSIAVSGVCLSVVAFNDESFTFDVVPETWKKTKLGSLMAGDRVNLERAMRVGDRFDGHMVQGHVQAVCSVTGSWFLVHGSDSVTRNQQPKTNNPWLRIQLPPDLLPYVIPKGSVTLDGVALTVADVQGDRCTVALIPHTLENTTLGALREGDAVNIETDVLGRYVHHLLQSHAY